MRLSYVFRADTVEEYTDFRDWYFSYPHRWSREPRGEQHFGEAVEKFDKLTNRSKMTFIIELSRSRPNSAIFLLSRVVFNQLDGDAVEKEV